MNRTVGWIAGAVTATGIVATLGIALAQDADSPDPPRPSMTAPTTSRSPSEPVPVPLVPAAALAALPEASTATTVAAAPADADPTAGTDGTVVHNPHVAVIFDAPGGVPIARLPVAQAGSPTWLPVIDRQPGWVRVLLPSRPNGATGWISIAELEQASTPFEIDVSVTLAVIRVLRQQTVVGAWPVAVGASGTPTPIVRTFLLASVIDDQQSFSPVILPLGAHSPTLTTYRGGPATTAIHTWPTRDVYGRAVTNGCLRVPPEALHILAQLPLGTIVYIRP